jgi:putative spermidine/putrescine transport system permease protein
MQNQAKRKIMTAGIIFFFFLFLIGPLFFLFLKSFTYTWQWPQWYTLDFHLKSWRAVWDEPKLYTALETTIIIAFSVIVLNLVMAVPAAKALSHHEFKGQSVIETFLFMPILIPSLAVAMGIHLTMIRLGLADSLVGVILVHLLPTLPYSIRMIRAGFDRIGLKWEEQAKTLGASPVSIFWTITLPLLLPSLRSTVLLTAVISLSQYVLTALIGGGRVLTLPLLYFPFFNSVNESIMAVYSVIFAVIPLLFLVTAELFFKLYLSLIRRV